jgi:hypothetical protein
MARWTDVASKNGVLALFRRVSREPESLIIRSVPVSKIAVLLDRFALYTGFSRLHPEVTGNLAV